ncbi:Rf1 [Symbiodinium sp. CCMP2456]|nr:Rf1 [Symbiodinium sp. CCMP2456]
MEVTDASNTFAHNTLLKAYAQKEQAEKAEKLFKTMAKPDATTYLQMIRVAASVSDPQGAADWLRRMSEAGLQPWVPHFHAVMTAHAKMGDMEGAEAWFRVMLDEGMRPELVSCNILMSAAANSGDTAGAEGMLLRMEDLQLRPDVVTYSTLLSAFAKAGNAIGARDWLLQAEEAGIEPDLNCYKQIIKACVQSGDAAMAERMARRLLRNRLTPDVYTYNMLLNALAKAGNWASAEFWVDHMQRAARWKHHEFPLDQISVAYAEVFLAHVEAGDLEGAEAWMMQMVGEGIEPQARCYTALVQRYLDQGDLGSAPASGVGACTGSAESLDPENFKHTDCMSLLTNSIQDPEPFGKLELNILVAFFCQLVIERISASTFRPLAFTEEAKNPANTVLLSQHHRSG